MTEKIITSRRSFLGGLLSVMAAPAIVSMTNIMPVKLMAWQKSHWVTITGTDAYGKLLIERIMVPENGEGLNMEIYNTGWDKAKTLFKVVDRVSWNDDLSKGLGFSKPEAWDFGIKLPNWTTEKKYHPRMEEGTLELPEQARNPELVNGIIRPSEYIGGDIGRPFYQEEPQD